MSKKKNYRSNFVTSQLKIVEDQLIELEGKYIEGSEAMRSYLYPKIFNLKKRQKKWLELFVENLDSKKTTKLLY